jgi:hypothetical protein
MPAEPKRRGFTITVSDALALLALVISATVAYFTLRPVYSVAVLETTSYSILSGPLPPVPVDGPVFKVSTRMNIENTGNRAIFVADIVGYHSAPGSLTTCSSNRSELRDDIVLLETE